MFLYVQNLQNLCYLETFKLLCYIFKVLLLINISVTLQHMSVDYPQLIVL